MTRRDEETMEPVGKVDPRHAADTDRYAEELSVLGLLNALLRNIGIMVTVPLVAMAVALVILLVQPRSFVATSRFVPDTPGQAAPSFSGIAARFGIDVGGGGGEDSPEFYASLIESQGLLKEAASTEYALARDGTMVRATLVELVDPDPDTPEQRLRSATGWLLEHTNAVAEEHTGTVAVSVSTPWPNVSVQVNQRILELVNEFNIERRQQRAAEERRFREERMREAEQELSAAEDSLEDFLESNRGGGTSPGLAARLDRLRRGVDLRQQFYVSLLQGHEQSRLEEVRSTPVIAVTERPEDTIRPEPLRVPLVLFLALLSGLILGGMIALLREFVQRQAVQYPEEFGELQMRLRRLKKRLRPGDRVR